MTNMREASEATVRSADLEQRLLAEEEFHDMKYGMNKEDPPHYKLQPTYQVFSRLKESLGNLTGMRVLECGCGSGWITAELAALGAEIEAFDISQQAVIDTAQMLERLGLASNCRIQKMSAEACNYPDNHFDVIVGFAILHHLDLDRALPEIFRVLKPNGRALFAEPLRGNPLINCYRLLTPKLRTPDERPLSLSDFGKKVSRFRGFCHEEFYLFALLPLAMANLVSPGPRLQQAFASLSRLDERVFKLLPQLRHWAWYSLITLEK